MMLSLKGKTAGHSKEEGSDMTNKSSDTIWKGFSDSLDG
jgi:hypothetical protein